MKYRKCIWLSKVVSFKDCENCDRLCKNTDKDQNLEKQSRFIHVAKEMKG